MGPTLRLHTQPSGDGDNAGEFLRGILTDPAIENVAVVVAWVRFRGLARLRDELDAFRERGKSRIILGIDEGGATRPGLIAALRDFSEAYVYHVRGGGTFHPKVYLASGLTKAHLFVGSSNLTPGGMFFNDEASLEAEFALPNEAEQPALLDAQAYIDRLLDDKGVCLRLTDELIEKLVADQQYRVSGTERRNRPADGAALPEGAEEDDVDEYGEQAAEGGDAEPTFGTSQRVRPAVPGLSAEARAELADLEGQEEEPETPVPPVPPPPQPPVRPAPPPPGPAPPALTVVAHWNKVMSRADAQQPSNPRTNPTGLLRLTQANHDIDHRTWFRHVLFGTAPWAPSIDLEGNSIEIATVPMDVTIRDVAHGIVDLVVDHAPHREEGQGNVLSILHWGPTLGPLLRATDYHGRTVTISHTSDGSYRLEIS